MPVIALYLRALLIEDQLNLKSFWVYTEQYKQLIINSKLVKLYCDILFLKIKKV
jgi:hypothetical protein